MMTYDLGGMDGGGWPSFNSGMGMGNFGGFQSPMMSSMSGWGQPQGQMVRRLQNAAYQPSGAQPDIAMAPQGQSLINTLPQQQMTGAQRGDARLQRMGGRMDQMQQKFADAGPQAQGALQGRMDTLRGKMQGLRADRRRGQGMYEPSSQAQPDIAQQGGQPEPAMLPGGWGGMPSWQMGGMRPWGGFAMNNYGGGYGQSPFGGGFNPQLYY